MIKILRPDEWNLWKKIRLEAVQKNPEAFGGSWEEESLQSDAEFERGLTNNAVFAKFDDDDVVGTAGFFINPRLKMKHRGSIFGVYVKPKWRGQGISRKLIEEVLGYAQNRVSQVHLTVSTTNNVAVNLYKSHGFTVYGEEKRALLVNGAYHDEFLMIKMLHERPLV